MRASHLVLPVLLAVYSGMLLLVEMSQGPGAAKVYLQDPAEAVLFGHVNTTLSTGLLWAIALLFAVGLKVDTAAGRQARLGTLFPVTQIVLFLFLGFDERFRLLPVACRALGVGEWVPYLPLAMVELGLLLGPGRLLARRREAALALGAGALFATSGVIDQLSLHGALRHSLEELPKVWGGALFLGMAWMRLHESVDALAFPGVHGAAFSWAQRGPGLQAAERPYHQPRALPQKNRAPAPGADALEPSPEDEAFVSSAAPPRKLLSH